MRKITLNILLIAFCCGFSGGFYGAAVADDDAGTISEPGSPVSPVQGLAPEDSDTLGLSIPIQGPDSSDPLAPKSPTRVANIRTDFVPEAGAAKYSSLFSPHGHHYVWQKANDRNVHDNRTDLLNSMAGSCGPLVFCDCANPSMLMGLLFLVDPNGNGLIKVSPRRGEIELPVSLSISNPRPNETLYDICAEGGALWAIASSFADMSPLGAGQICYGKINHSDMNQKFKTQLQFVAEQIEVLDEAGNPKRDSDGNIITQDAYDPNGYLIPKPAVDGSGNPILDEDGNPIPVPVFDEDGNQLEVPLLINGEEVPELDKDGNEVYEPSKDEKGNPVIYSFRSFYFKDKNENWHLLTSLGSKRLANDPTFLYTDEDGQLLNFSQIMNVDKFGHLCDVAGNEIKTTSLPTDLNLASYGAKSLMALASSLFRASDDQEDNTYSVLEDHPLAFFAQNTQVDLKGDLSAALEAAWNRSKPAEDRSFAALLNGIQKGFPTQPDAPDFAQIAQDCINKLNSFFPEIFSDEGKATVMEAQPIVSVPTGTTGS